MAKELFPDPFVFFKSFKQDGEVFDPHQLPFMSSLWPTLILSCLYLIALRVTER